MLMFHSGWLSAGLCVLPWQSAPEVRSVYRRRPPIQN
jgi:hypothetical protein